MESILKLLRFDSVHKFVLSVSTGFFVYGFSSGALDVFAASAVIMALSLIGWVLDDYLAEKVMSHGMVAMENSSRTARVVGKVVFVFLVGLTMVVTWVVS